MKKILLILTAFLFALSSCVHLGDLELEPVPDIAFTYTQNSGLEFTFTSSVEGTTNVGWEVIGIEGATATGDSFTYNFPEPGTYWVRMTGTYNGGEQTFTGKIAVDWAATISFKDGSLDDWDLVTKPEYIFHGGDTDNYPTQAEPILVEGKFDYDANYIYVYASFLMLRQEPTSMSTATASTSTLTWMPILRQVVLIWETASVSNTSSRPTSSMMKKARSA